MAPNVTNYAEIQHDEIEALRSIYMDDFTEHETKPGPWNVGLVQRLHDVGTLVISYVCSNTSKVWRDLALLAVLDRDHSVLRL